jgi:hypothetical protein
LTYYETLGVLFIDGDTFVVFCIKEIVASHVRVSLAHVVVMVAHVSVVKALAVLLNVPTDGFAVLSIAILPVTYATWLYHHLTIHAPDCKVLKHKRFFFL